MSQENVEVILQEVEAITRQDAEAFVATVSPDVEWEDAMFWSEPRRIYRGRQELQEWFVRAIVEPGKASTWRLTRSSTPQRIGLLPGDSYRTRKG